MKSGSRLGALAASLVLWLAPGSARASPVEVAPTAMGDVQQPHVTIDDAGGVFVVFGRGEEIHVAISADNGAHFEAPRQVARLPNLALGMRRGPRIAASGRALTVTAMNFNDLYAYHSEDAGRTWSAPVKINTIATSAREGLGNLAAGPAGSFYATWLDLRSGTTEVFGALSRDGGRTWGTNELVYRAPGGPVCECCHPSAAFNRQGDLVVMWRNSLKGARDLWAATRPADSDRFGPAVKLGSGTWKLNACPMDGGAVFTQDDGTPASIWRRDQNVFLSLAPARELRLGPGSHPLGLTANGHVHAWWQQGADLMHTTAGRKDAPDVFAKSARFAAAASSPKDGTVVVVFERLVGQRKAIFAEILK